MGGVGLAWKAALMGHPLLVGLSPPLGTMVWMVGVCVRVCGHSGTTPEY